MNARAASLCELIVRLSFGDCWAPVSAPCRGGRPKRDGVREEKASNTQKGKNSFVVSCGACGCYSLSSEVPQNPKKSPAVTCIMSCVFQPTCFPSRASRCGFRDQAAAPSTVCLHASTGVGTAGPVVVRLAERANERERERFRVMQMRKSSRKCASPLHRQSFHTHRTSFATSLRSRLLLRAAARKTLLAPLCGI